MDTQPSASEPGVDVYAKMLDTVIRNVPVSQARDLWIDAIKASHDAWQQSHADVLREGADASLLIDALTHVMIATSMIAAVMPVVVAPGPSRAKAILQGIAVLNSLLAEFITYGDNRIPLADTVHSKYRDGSRMIVIGISRTSQATKLHLQDANDWRDTVCIDVAEVRCDNNQPVNIELGDQVWWQDKIALWTPKAARKRDAAGCGVIWDIHLAKIGFSHSASHYASLSHEEIEKLIKPDEEHSDS